MAEKRKINRAKIALKKIERLAAQRQMEGTVGMADQFYNPFDLRRPSGITSLDLETGGGLPAGGLSQIDGPDGIGKNYLLFQYMRMCQLIYGEEAAIAMACFENLIDKAYARNVGVQIAYSDYEIELEQKRRREIDEPKLKKKEIEELQTQLGVFALARGEHEHVLDSVLRFVASNAYQIVGVDSWDVTLTKKEGSKTMRDKRGVAAAAGLHTNFMNHLHSILNQKDEDGRENETTIIGIRQVRADIADNSMYAPPYKAQGAHSLRHGKLVNVSLEKGAAIKDESGGKSGKVIKWAITKGKAGCHDGPRGEYHYHYDPPRVDVVLDLWNSAVTYEAITQKNKRKNEYDFEDLHGSKEGILAMMRDDEEVRTRIRKALQDQRGYNIRYT